MFDPLSLVECCMFNKETVFLGYSDGSIYAWNMKSGTLIYSYQGHEDKVSALVWIDLNTFASSSFDSTIVFWDSREGVSNSIFRLSNEISSMERHKDTMFVISNFNELTLINISKSQIFRSVVFADMNITCIHVTEEEFLFGDYFNHLYVVKRLDLEVLSILNA